MSDFKNTNPETSNDEVFKKEETIKTFGPSNAENSNKEPENIKTCETDVVKEDEPSVIRSFDKKPPEPITIEEHDMLNIEIKKPTKKKSKAKPILFGLACALCICGLIVGTSFLTVKVLTGYLGEPTEHVTTQPTLSNENGPSIEIVNNGSSDTTIPMTDGNAVPLTVPQINVKVSPSVVGITAQSLSAGSSSIGTGIIMSDDGYVITNNHVIEGGNIINVILNDGKQYNAELIGADSTTDLAVLKFVPDVDDQITPAEFGNSDALVVGDLAIAIGTPGGLELQNTLTGGYISAINRDIFVEDQSMTLIQTDASINPGNSGGPLINQFGQVIGINTIKIGDIDFEGLGFAIPINEAKPIIDELIAYGYVTGRPSIGISGYIISEEVAAYNGIPQGLQVISIDTRSDAFAQGLKINDIITGINGTVTKNMDEINAVKEEFSAGDKITLNVYRGGRYIDIVIALMDENAMKATVPEQGVVPQAPQNPVPEQTDPYEQYYNMFPFFGN